MLMPGGIRVMFAKHVEKPYRMGYLLFVRDQPMLDGVMDGIRWHKVWREFRCVLIKKNDMYRPVSFLISPIAGPGDQPTPSACKRLREFLSEIFYRDLPWLQDRGEG